MNQRPAGRALPLLLIALWISAALGVANAAAATNNEAQKAADSAFLLYPDLHQDFVVFVAAGDLWRVPTAGGAARRLTSHAGQELFPKISPDGQWIAFSAEYSGSRQVWIMPAAGGNPRQLTFYSEVSNPLPRAGFDSWVLGWTPDGKILARFNRTPWGDRMGRYFLVDPQGGLEQELPIPHGGTASYSPDGRLLAYTPLDREFRTWKRTHGGRAQDLWTYDFANQQSRRLTDFRGTDNFPMWWGDRIYFTSDRSYTLNLFSIAPDGSDLRQHTDFTDLDMLWPSTGPGGIVFVRGFRLYQLDPTTDRVTEIPVELQADLVATLPRFEDLEDDLALAVLGPTGKRLIVEARGELFSLPAEKGGPRNLTQSPAIRERDPALSPDGQQLAYLSDATGEYELFVRPLEGKTPARQLTQNSRTWYFTPVFSPDGRWIALPDRERKLSIIEVATGKARLVDRGFREDLTQLAWSPDSRYLAYERTREESRLVGISLYDLVGNQIHRLGDGLTTDFSPAFSADGSHLFFLSNRDYDLTFSAFEFNYLYTDATRVYATALDPTAPALFPLQSDEEPRSEEPRAEEARSDKAPSPAEKNAAKKASVVQTAGWVARTIALPGHSAGNLTTLRVTADAAYFLRFGDSGNATLQRYDFKARKEELVLAGAQDYLLSADGKKLAIQTGSGFQITNAAPGAAAANGKLDLSQWRLKVEPRVEWRQIFEDAWRVSRDYFYDPHHHGMDWQAIGERYRRLLPGITQRQDLDLLIGEMIGELGAGHTYVRPADAPKKTRIIGGLLGAELEADATGFYRIRKIFQGENWDEAWRSPLTEPGIVAKNGDFLLAIDGVALGLQDNPYRLLEGKANMLVTLTLHDRPTFDGAREVVIKTIGSEVNLRYLDWVKSRMELVDRLSGGKVGYIHLPNTAVEGNRMMQKLFYSQSNREALIIDDRFNQGGFIPDRLIEYLLRTPLAWWSMRDLAPMRTPAFAHHGPKAMLMNGFSASGGDALPYFFRLRGLGPLIGTRTWGGLIGLNGNPSFLDGGGVDICTFRIFDAEGQWVVENEGVVPDFEVFDTPEGLAKGDPSIEKAVTVLLETLARQKPISPAAPLPPDLSEKNASN